MEFGNGLDVAASVAGSSSSLEQLQCRQRNPVRVSAVETTAGGDSERGGAASSSGGAQRHQREQQRRPRQTSPAAGTTAAGVRVPRRNPRKGSMPRITLGRLAGRTASGGRSPAATATPGRSRRPPATPQAAGRGAGSFGSSCPSPRSSLGFLTRAGSR